MSGLGFLAIVLVLSVVGSVIVWLRHRQPTHVSSSVSEFQREMDALGRPPTPRQQPRPVRPVRSVERRGGGR